MSDLRFQLSDFLDVESRHERTIIIRTGNFKQLLKRKIKELAVERCQEMARGPAREMCTDGWSRLSGLRFFPKFFRVVNLLCYLSSYG